jgi:hypothetical protein
MQGTANRTLFKARWQLNVGESHLRGFLHGHAVHSYGVEPWPATLADQIVLARHPAIDEDVHRCNRCGVPIGTYIQLVEFYCIHNFTRNYCKVVVSLAVVLIASVDARELDEPGVGAMP